MGLQNMSENEQQKFLSEKMIPVVETETQLRKWERRLIVAITPEEKQKCKQKINQYG